MKQPTLQRIEAGLRLDPSIRTIAALANALGMTIDALLDLPQASAVIADASQLAFDAIEQLTRHCADVELKLELRIRALEETVERRNMRQGT